MYNYDDYMRNLLGYPIQSPLEQQENNTYQRYNAPEAYENEYISRVEMYDKSELESMYPEIYKVVYPMVKKACEENNLRGITQEMLDKMAYDIYFKVENDERTSSLNNTENSNIKNRTTLNTSSSNAKTNTSTNAISESRREESRQRVPRNRTLLDLIRILILRELLNRPGRPRPPRPRPRPPRPREVIPPFPIDFEDYSQF